MDLYKCEKCGMRGYGFPSHKNCPNCGTEIMVKIEDEGEKLEDGKYVPFSQLPYMSAHWIISSDGYYPYCSSCGEEPKSGLLEKYCPTCGKRMRKSEREGFVWYVKKRYSL